jgi:hypothetical protein
VSIGIHEGFVIFSRHSGDLPERKKEVSWILLVVVLLNQELPWDLTSCVTIVTKQRVVVGEVDRESTQRQVIVAAEDRRRQRAEVYARIVETGVVEICHMMGMADTAQEEYCHVDIAAELGDRSCCRGSYSHCTQVSPAGIAGGCMSASDPYLVACPALPADDVRSSCRRRCFPPTRSSGWEEMRSERSGNEDIGKEYTDSH